MLHLSIDIETYSDIDIKKSGAYKYAQSQDFEILLFAYSVDNGQVEIVDLKNGEVIPEEIVTALNNPSVTKHAFNATFEWWCLNQAGYRTSIEQWACTMVHSLYLGYPVSLKAVGEAVGLPQEKQKLRTGKALIQYFCSPCKASKVNGGRTRNLPHHDKDKWDLFKEYCIQDVVTEMEIERRLSNFPVPNEEHNMWVIDQKINSYGVRLDRTLIRGALEIDDYINYELVEKAKDITGLSNPNSNAQLMEWLNNKGVETENLQKATVTDLVENIEDGEVKEVLKIRQETSKTSIKKYATMENAKCDDGRVRGLLQFYGANRTGRWAGRLVQVQNLPRNYINTLDIARDLAKERKIDNLKLIYGNVTDTLSQLIRTAFIPTEGNKFVVADFASIEARVLAWLAGEQWKIEVSKSHGKFYEATASQMFGVPIEKIKKGNPEYSLRSNGKVAELACGYQGGSNALIAMGALDMGLTEGELPDIVRRWRGSNKRIVDFWYAVENAVLHVMQTGQAVGLRGLIFAREGDLLNGQDFLTITLPSKRKLYYPKPSLKPNSFGKMALHYMGLDTGKWKVLSTYGGKLVENITQAVARDCLAETIKKIDRQDLKIVMHIHDEVVIDAPQDIKLDDVCEIMAEPIPWAPGLCLKGAGFEGNYYMKD